MTKARGYLILWAVWSGGIFTSVFEEHYHVGTIWAIAIGILWIFPLGTALRAFRKAA